MPVTTITDVRTIGITVANQDEALAFFVDTLGFEKRLDAPISPTMRWVEVAPPGASTSIALNAAEASADIGANVGADTGVRFTVPNAAAEQAAMRERGVDVGRLGLGLGGHGAARLGEGWPRRKLGGIRQG